MHEAKNGVGEPPDTAFADAPRKYRPALRVLARVGDGGFHLIQKVVTQALNSLLVLAHGGDEVRLRLGQVPVPVAHAVRVLRTNFRASRMTCSPGIAFTWPRSSASSR